MSEDKIKQLVVKLIALTQDDKLRWNVLFSDTPLITFDPIPYVRDGEAIGCLYFTELMGKKFILYQFRTRWWLSEDDWRWNEPIAALHMIVPKTTFDHVYVSCFQFPETVNMALQDLYFVVQEQTITKDDFIDEVLNIR